VLQTTFRRYSGLPDTIEITGKENRRGFDLCKEDSMKLWFISGLTALVTSLVVAPMALAEQTDLSDPAADLNGDGEVTLIELKLYNMNERDA
jgi:hypothetical protein